MPLATEGYEIVSFISSKSKVGIFFIELSKFFALSTPFFETYAIA